MKNNEHIVKSFEQDLEELLGLVIKMKDLAVKLTKLSEKSLVNTKEDFYEQAVAQDKEVNKLEKDIESQAIALLALRQPMAGDLRVIVSTIKIVSLLERIADRGKKTIKKAKRLSKAFDKSVTEDVSSMNKIAISMIEEVIDNLKNYKSKDLKKAIDEDDKVDEFYSQTMHKVISEQEKKPQELEEFIAKIKILKNFERVGDYATKMAKLVRYAAEGEAGR